MQIDGKQIAEDILTTLKQEVQKLSAIPTLAVVQLGDNPASLAYIRQKKKAAENIGARVIISNDIADVARYNIDLQIHGLIVQRPVPSDTLRYAVIPRKDVDGFEPYSPFDVPVALAVWTIIQSTGKTPKTFAVIGRGETAGAPIARYLEKQNCATSIIHSQTPNPVEIMRRADCIISCVGKDRVLTKEHIKPGAILIGVGIWRNENGKLRGDYNEEEIADSAGAYTPTPGGVGPVNVACLMQNLVKACKMNISA